MDSDFPIFFKISPLRRFQRSKESPPPLPLMPPQRSTLPCVASCYEGVKPQPARWIVTLIKSLQCGEHRLFSRQSNLLAHLQSLFALHSTDSSLWFNAIMRLTKFLAIWVLAACFTISLAQIDLRLSTSGFHKFCSGASVIRFPPHSTVSFYPLYHSV